MSFILTSINVLLLLAMTIPTMGWTAPSAVEKAPGCEEGSFQPERVENIREEKTEEAHEDGCPATFGPIITDTAVPIEKGRFALQPTFGLSFLTNGLSPSWRRVSAGGDFQTINMSWKLTYGLMNNLEVYVVIPYFHNWASNVDASAAGPKNERFASFGGLNDISLTFKYRLVEETQALPTVSAVFTPTFPSGHFRHLNPGRLGTDLIGSGSYVFTSGLNLSKYLKPFVFYGNFGYSIQTATDNDDGRNYPRDFVTVNLAAEYPITKKWAACLEFVSLYDGGRLFGRKPNIVPRALISLAPEIEFMATDKFALSLGVNCDLAGKNNTANITPLISMVYAF